MTSLGTCRLVIPRSESTMARAGPSASSASKDALISAPSGSDSRPTKMAAEPVVRAEACRGKRRAVAGESLREEGAHHMAEDDRVRDLHHRGLEVHREQDAVGLGPSDLGGQERAQRRDTHHRRIHYLARQNRNRLPKNGGLAVITQKLDAQRPGLADHRGLLGGPEVVVVHVRDVRLRIGRPRSHAVGMCPGIVLDRCGRTPIGVPLPQHGVHGAPHQPVVPGANTPVLVGLWIVWKVRKGITLPLQLRDGGLELWARRRDVRQLDDVGLGGLGQFSQLSQGVRAALILLEVFGELGEDPPSQRDVAGLHPHTGG